MNKWVSYVPVVRIESRPADSQPGTLTVAPQGHIFTLILKPGNVQGSELPTFMNRWEFRCLAGCTLLGVRVFKKLEHNFGVLAQHNEILKVYEICCMYW